MLRQSVISYEPIEFIGQIAGEPVSAYRSQQIQPTPIPVIGYLLFSYIAGIAIRKGKNITDLALIRINLVRAHESDPISDLMRQRSGKNSARQVSVLTPKPDAQGSPI